MSRFSVILSIFFIFNGVKAYLDGPFILWGPKRLKDMKLPALKPIEESTLTSLYGDVKAIIIFQRNTTKNLDAEDFPNFKALIDKNDWIYLAQDSLPVEPPPTHNLNVEIVSLVGPLSQQDVELSALYRDSVNIYGNGNVLGILADQMNVHNIFKRDAEGSTEPILLSSTPGPSTTPPSAPTEEPMREDFIYIAAEKAILYTTAAPVLETEVDDKTVVKELKVHGFVQFDTRNNSSRLIVTFITDDSKQSKTTLRFRFPIISNYWYLNSVEVEEKEFSDILTVEGEPPSAPIGFSYKCSQPLTFRNGSNSLKLQSIQVQPLLDGANKFSDAYDCVGFTSAPIWSGLFVSFIVIIGTFIGIIAIMEIKAPNRFESSRSKQLTFTVQE